MASIYRIERKDSFQSRLISEIAWATVLVNPVLLLVISEEVFSTDVGAKPELMTLKCSIFYKISSTFVERRDSVYYMHSLLTGASNPIDSQLDMSQWDTSRCPVSGTHLALDHLQDL